MSTDPQDPRRLQWLADYQTTRESLDRMGVPKAPSAIWAHGKQVPDTSPETSLVWRLAWLEGQVAFLRGQSEEPVEPPEPEPPEPELAWSELCADLWHFGRGTDRPVASIIQLQGKWHASVRRSGETAVTEFAVIDDLDEAKATVEAWLAPYLETP